MKLSLSEALCSVCMRMADEEETLAVKAFKEADVLQQPETIS